MVEIGQNGTVNLILIAIAAGITEEASFAAEPTNSVRELSGGRIYDPMMATEILDHLPSRALSTTGLALAHSCLATSSTDTQP